MENLKTVVRCYLQPCQEKSLSLYKHLLLFCHHHALNSAAR